MTLSGTWLLCTNSFQNTNKAKFISLSSDWMQTVIYTWTPQAEFCCKLSNYLPWLSISILTNTCSANKHSCKLGKGKPWASCEPCRVTPPGGVKLCHGRREERIRTVPLAFFISLFIILGVNVFCLGNPV